MKGIQYVNMIEIGLVVIEIQGVENSELAVPVNNTFVRHTAFLATDTWSCVLIYIFIKVSLGDHDTNFMIISLAKSPVVWDK